MKRMYVEETLFVKAGFEGGETWILDNFDDYSYFKVQVGDFASEANGEMKYFEYYVNEYNVFGDYIGFVSDDGKISILFDNSTKKIEVDVTDETVFGIVIKGVKC